MKSITPTLETVGYDSRYLFNSSNNKNYMDLDNVFMDGGTGAM
jgi:hypothetical protein